MFVATKDNLNKLGVGVRNDLYTLLGLIRLPFLHLGISLSLNTVTGEVSVRDVQALRGSVTTDSELGMHLSKLAPQPGAAF